MAVCSSLAVGWSFLHPALVVVQEGARHACEMHPRLVEKSKASMSILKTACVCMPACAGPIAGQRFIQQQQQQLQQAGLPPYIVQAQQQGFAPDAPKPAQPAAAQFPKVCRSA